MEIHIKTHRLMGGIYEVHRIDRLRYDDIYTKFNKNWFRYSNVDREAIQIHRQQGDLISLLLLSKIRNVG
jgi:hypothetical protein